MCFRSQCVAVAVCVIALGGWVVTAHAADHDLSTQVSGPYGAGPGGAATITVSYHNAGPESADTAYVNAWIPSGVPVPFTELTQAHLDALYASVVPNGLGGNAAYLFGDTSNCEHLLFQIQQDTGPMPDGLPMVGIDPGVTGSISFDVEMPMEPPDLAGFIIDDPPSLAKEYAPATGLQYLVASEMGSYTRGTCDPAVECLDLSACFGPLLSYTDPIPGNLELVNDGSANPTWACEPLVGFTAGNMAVIERGLCEFGVKGVNAQDAGATAVVMVNDGRCAGVIPDSTRCAINMGAGVVGDQLTIPIIMLSVDDGQPIIDALNAATAVHATMGTVREYAAFDGEFTWVGVFGDDPDLLNNYSTHDLRWGYIFVDGFESGDTTAWSRTVP